ncbi:MAG: hypothetical protein RhofKO_40660 [Rhodothermales bacterium]
MRKLTGLLSLTLALFVFGCQDAVVDATSEADPLTVDDIAALGTSDNAPVQARYDADAHAIIVDAVVPNEAVFVAVMVDPAFSPPTDGKNAKVFGSGAIENPLVGLLKLEAGQTENITIPLIDDMPESTSVPAGQANLIVSFHTDTHELGVFEHSKRVEPGRAFLLDRDFPVVHDYTFTDESTGVEITQTWPLHAFLIIDV